MINHSNAIKHRKIEKVRTPGSVSEKNSRVSLFDCENQLKFLEIYQLDKYFNLKCEVKNFF